MIALRGLAQGNHDGPLAVSLEAMMAPPGARVAALRLKSFAVALADEGPYLALPSGAAAGRLN